MNRAARRRMARDLGAHRAQGKAGTRPAIRAAAAEVVRPTRPKLPGIIKTRSGLYVVEDAVRQP